MYFFLRCFALHPYYYNHYYAFKDHLLIFLYAFLLTTCHAAKMPWMEGVDVRLCRVNMLTYWL